MGYFRATQQLVAPARYIEDCLVARFRFRGVLGQVWHHCETRWRVNSGAVWQRKDTFSIKLTSTTQTSMIALAKKKGEEMKFAGWYSTIVGVLNLGMWAFFLASGQVPELQTAPLEISFHLAAELVMALVLIMGGVAILTNRGWGRFISLIALGMLLYSVVNSSGYFAQLSQWQFVGMFAVLLVFALVSLVKLARFREV